MLAKFLARDRFRSGLLLESSLNKNCYSVFFKYLSNHLICSQCTCSMLSRAR